MSADDVSEKEDVVKEKLNVIPSNIPQLDGNDEFSEEEVVQIPTHLYSIHTEYEKICNWLNFFRGLDCLWASTNNHGICNLKKNDGGFSNCLFCVMRSACLRLNHRGKKGPKFLKPAEVFSQLGQLNWNEASSTVFNMIGQTTAILINCGEEVKKNFMPCNIVCKNCEEKNLYPQNEMISINTENVELGSQNSLAEIIYNSSSKCEHRRFTDIWNQCDGKLVILTFSKPVHINVQLKERLLGCELHYKSHIQQKKGF